MVTEFDFFFFCNLSAREGFNVICCRSVVGSTTLPCSPPSSFKKTTHNPRPDHFPTVPSCDENLDPSAASVTTQALHATKPFFTFLHFLRLFILVYRRSSL